MKVSYEGVAEQVATFQVDGASNPAVQVGTVVALSGNGTVKACPASTAPAGVVLGVKDGLAAVQVAGTGRGGLVVEVDGGTCGVIFC